MAIDYSKWDKQIDVKGLIKDIEEAKSSTGTGEFVDVPAGEYEVKISKLELVASKKDSSPMITCWFEIVAGERKGQRIFMNSIVTKGWQIHRANEFLRSLDSGVEIKFENFVQYGQMLLDIHEAIDGKLEFALDYSQDAKGYDTFKIVEIFEVA